MAAVKQLGSILKTNVRACKALGHAYVSQLGRIYLDMLNVYKIMSENITQAIALNGLAINNQPLIKAMHVVKKETLTLISEWVSKSNDSQMVMENFIPPLLETVLFDYQVGSTNPNTQSTSYIFVIYCIIAYKGTERPRTTSTQHDGIHCQQAASGNYAGNPEDL